MSFKPKHVFSSSLCTMGQYKLLKSNQIFSNSHKMAKMGHSNQGFSAILISKNESQNQTTNQVSSRCVNLNNETQLKNGENKRNLVITY